jgi:hypothetical protein
MMDFQQTDANANASAIAALCSGASLNTDTGSSLATVGGTTGSTPRTTTMDANATNLAAVWFEITVPDGTTWGAGDWTINLNISTGNMAVVWDAVYICRVNSSYVSQATIGSSTGLAKNLAATGVQTATVSGSSQTPSAGDKAVVVLLFNNSVMGGSAFGWTPDQLISAAGFAAGGGGGGGRKGWHGKPLMGCFGGAI